MPRQDVQNDGGRVDTLAQRFRTGRVNSFEPVGQNRAQEIDHLAVTIRHTAQLALDTPHGRRQLPFLEGRTVP